MTRRKITAVSKLLSENNRTNVTSPPTPLRFDDFFYWLSPNVGLNQLLLSIKSPQKPRFESKFNVSNPPPNWRAFPQSADCSSKLEGVSAASGLFLQTGGRFRSQRIVPPNWRAFPLTSEASRKSAGAFPSLKNHQNPPFLPFCLASRACVCIKKPCCSIFGTTGWWGLGVSVRIILLGIHTHILSVWFYLPVCRVDTSRLKQRHVFFVITS